MHEQKAMIIKRVWMGGGGGGGTLQNFVRGGSVPRSNPLPFCSSTLTEKVLISEGAFPYRLLEGVHPCVWIKIYNHVFLSIYFATGRIN